MKRPVIAVDVDDVLAAHAQAFVDFSNQRWGTNLTVDDYNDDWSILWGLDRAIDEHRQEIAERASAFRLHSTVTMPHEASAHDVLLRLKDRYDLIIVTARQQQIKGETLAWIKEKFPGIFQEDRIFFTGFYDTIRKDSAVKTKGDILKSLGADYLIDDQPKHCNSAMELGIQGLLYGNYAWQTTEPVHDGVVRVADWSEVEDYFGEVSTGNAS